MLTRRDFLQVLGVYGLQYCASRLGYPQVRSGQSSQDLPNILILVLDTLSATRMSLYGCNQKTTPNLQSLAARSDVYHRHYAAGNFTSPGTTSLLTGTYPWTHRCINMYGTVLDYLEEHNLFETLAGAYYKTAYTQNPMVMLLLDQFKAAIDHLPPIRETSLSSDTITNVFQADFRHAFWGEAILRARDGFFLPSTLFLSILKKFRQFLGPILIPRDVQARYPLGVPLNYQGSTFILEDTIDWLQEEISTYPTPFVSYLHLWPPHEPYWPRADFVGYFEADPAFQIKPEHYFSAGKSNQQLADAQLAYDAYLAYTDAEIGRLLTYLEEQGILENTLLILTSDHGEAFEKGIEGHRTPVMFESLVHIPLLVTWPGSNQRRDFHTPTSAVDLLPSLLHLTGQPIPTWCEGQVLPGFLDTQNHSSRQIYCLEAKESSKFSTITKGTLVVVDENYKLVRYIGYEGYQDETECFDLKNDPQELNNLFPGDPIAQELKTLADHKIQVISQP